MCMNKLYKLQYFVTHVQALPYSQLCGLPYDEITDVTHSLMMFIA